MNKSILPAVLVTGLLLLSGCTQIAQGPAGPGTTAGTPAPSQIPSSMPVVHETTPAPATPVVTATITAPFSPASTTIPPTAEPVDISAIRFVRYADGDFSLEYPATWNVSKSTYYPYYCSPTETSRCYAKEIGTIGPFNFSESAQLKKPSRIVRFTSPDGALRVVVFISDFRDNLAGLYQINPDIGWVMNRVHAIFPDVSGLAAVSNYRYDRSANAMTFSYTVILPKLTEDYPLAYASENIVTVHHDYEFVFVTDNANFEKYRNLREKILSSIVPNDIV